MTGQRYGSLTAIKYCGNSRWLFRCDCGNEKIILGSNVRKGTTKSCGCQQNNPPRDLTGKRYGRLTVLKYDGNAHWLCRCSCGTIKSIFVSDFTSGRTRSCGCLANENLMFHRVNNRKHGMSKTRVYSIYYGMLHRCYNERLREFKNYGGRGIKVCDRWLGEHGFENFLIDMGDRPSPKHSIDRIDVNGDYCPENCRWVTTKEQANNTRSNAYYTFNGKTQTLKQWCEELNFDYVLAKSRRKSGLSSFNELFGPKKRRCNLRRVAAGVEVCVGKLGYNTTENGELICGV